MSSCSLEGEIGPETFKSSGVVCSISSAASVHSVHDVDSSSSSLEGEISLSYSQLNPNSGTEASPVAQQSTPGLGSGVEAMQGLEATSSTGNIRKRANLCFSCLQIK